MGHVVPCTRDIDYQCDFRRVNRHFHSVWRCLLMDAIKKCLYSFVDTNKKEKHCSETNCTPSVLLRIVCYQQKGKTNHRMGNRERYVSKSLGVNGGKTYNMANMMDPMMDITCYIQRTAWQLKRNFCHVILNLGLSS